MLTKRIIPCLDCKNGKVVKGIKFQNLNEIGSPAEIALAYEMQGADEIVLLDVGATIENRKNQINTIKEVRRSLSIPLTVGGGIKSIQDIYDLLQAGADKVSLNTAAVRTPNLINEAARRFGAQCIVVAIDGKKTESGWDVLTKSGTQSEGIDVCLWASRVAERGAGEILLTSFDRDGTCEGYDLELIRAVAHATQLPIIASGGARNSSDLKDGIIAGADAVLAASIFHYGELTVQEVKRDLKNLGVSVRL